MQLNFTGDILDLQEGIRVLEKRLCFFCDDRGIPVDVKQRKGDIEVKFKDGAAFMEFERKTHFFRALGLLVEAIANGSREFSISETPRFKTNGIMADCSRNSVLTVGSIKETIEIMAVMGLNMIMMYTEDTYEVKSYPYFGYMRGRYTHEELSECDRYADIFGIEMIPCIQTLAHLSAVLKWNHVPGIRDTGDILFVGEDATYEFIEEMVKSASAPFQSKRIHIGMDEAHDVGLGKYLFKHGYRRRFDILNEHLTRVMEITEKYGLKPMMWSDMYFRLGSKTGEYYDENAAIPEDVAESIPKNIQMVYWDYYHNDAKEYKTFINMHKELNRDTILAGGIWTWNRFAVDYGKTFKITDAGLSACKEEGVAEVFATMWGDNGGEANFFGALLGLQLYAEHGYSDAVDRERLSERFKFCTGQNMDDYLALSKLDMKEFEDTLTPSNPSKCLLWQDILIGLFDKHIDETTIGEYYQSLAKELERAADNAGNLRHVFEVVFNLARVLSVKAGIGAKLKKAYDSGDTETLRRLSENELKNLYKLVEELRNAHRRQWFTTYKPFGWEVIDMRYGGLLARIDTAIFRIGQYLNKEIDLIPELSEARLYFDGEAEDKQKTVPNSYFYHRMASAGSFGFLS